MAKKTKSADGPYFLKIMLFLILGSLWLRFSDANLSYQAPIPVGLLIGLLFAAHEHFQIDKKIEYAVLLVSCFVGFWVQAGIVIIL